MTSAHLAIIVAFLCLLRAWEAIQKELNKEPVAPVCLRFQAHWPEPPDWALPDKSDYF